MGPMGPREQEKHLGGMEVRYQTAAGLKMLSELLNNASGGVLKGPRTGPGPKNKRGFLARVRSLCQMWGPRPGLMPFSTPAEELDQILLRI